MIECVTIAYKFEVKGREETEKSDATICKQFLIANFGHGAETSHDNSPHRKSIDT